MGLTGFNRKRRELEQKPAPVEVLEEKPAKKKKEKAD